MTIHTRAAMKNNRRSSKKKHRKRGRSLTGIGGYYKQTISIKAKEVYKSKKTEKKQI